MIRCDFCNERKPLTIAGASFPVAGTTPIPPATICASCVWRCAAKLVEHNAPPEAPVRLDVIATVSR